MSISFNKETLTASLIGLTGVILFSAKAVLAKYMYLFGIDAVSTLLLRMVFALPVYVIIALVYRAKNRNLQHRPSDYMALVLLGMLGYYLASYFDFSGLQYITASLERLILFVYPTMVLILSRIMYKTPITRQQVLAIIITYSGIVVAFSGGIQTSAGNTNIALGTVLIFASALTYSFYLIQSGRYIPKFGTVYFTSVAMTVSCASVVVHYLLSGSTGLFDFPSEVYISAAAMALFSTVIPSFLISEAIRRMGSNNVSIIGSFGPVSTIILATIFLNEKITLLQFIGTMVVIAGVMIINVKKKPKYNS